MFATSAFKTWINTIPVEIKGLSDEESRKLMVSTSIRERDRVIKETKARSGFEPSYRQIVDGNDAAALETVRPDGVVIYAWQYAVEVADDTLSALVNRSPYDEGDYIKGIIVLLDGQEGLLKDVNINTRKIQIVSSVVYARRLEVGKRKDGRSFVLQVAPHIVEETATVAQKLYGNLAHITFEYIELKNAYRLQTSSSFRRSRGTVIVDMRYPTITIEPRVS